jgi:3-deoxy-D-manno-octulosonate 8-phosphate phosphatase KdsC-like HAD superfamily phosphatase
MEVTDIYGYLRAHAGALGGRILEMYPPLQNTTDAEAVAYQMGIFHFHSELLPEQKAVEVAAHTRRARTVAMVGDRINDAPALSEATVGVAMDSGTDVARESADVVLPAVTDQRLPGAGAKQVVNIY